MLCRFSVQSMPISFNYYTLTSSCYQTWFRTYMWSCRKYGSIRNVCECFILTPGDEIRAVMLVTKQNTQVIELHVLAVWDVTLCSQREGIPMLNCLYHEDGDSMFLQNTHIYPPDCKTLHHRMWALFCCHVNLNSYVLCITVCLIICVCVWHTRAHECTWGREKRWDRILLVLKFSFRIFTK
jgi:hypothetical protein